MANLRSLGAWLARRCSAWSRCMCGAANISVSRDGAGRRSRRRPRQFGRQPAGRIPEAIGVLSLDAARRHHHHRYPGTPPLSDQGRDTRDPLRHRRRPRRLHLQGLLQITRKAEWPDWHPPSEMIERQPYLPRFMAGGPGNPLGARAMYLGNTVYRIHGTNAPETIGQAVSSAASVSSTTTWPTSTTGCKSAPTSSCSRIRASGSPVIASEAKQSSHALDCCSFRSPQ